LKTKQQKHPSSEISMQLDVFTDLLLEVIMSSLRAGFMPCLSNNETQQDHCNPMLNLISKTVLPNQQDSKEDQMFPFHKTK